MISLSELVNLLFEKPSEPASKAAKEAEKYGLEYVGWGLWVNKHGARVARSVDGGERLAWMKGVTQKNYQTITHNVDKKTPGYKKYDNPVSQQVNKAGHYEPHSPTATVKGQAGGPEPVVYEPGYTPNAAAKDPDSPWNVAKQSKKLTKLPEPVPMSQFQLGDPGDQPPKPEEPKSPGAELRPWPKTPQQRNVFVKNTDLVLDKSLGKLKGSSPDAETAKRGFRYYTTSEGAQAINQYLRKGVKPYNMNTVNSNIMNIKKGFEMAAPLPESILVFRGTSIKSMLGATSKEHALKRLQEFKASGALIHDKGVVSTSQSYDFASQWKSGQSVGVLFNIQVPKGAKAVKLNPIHGSVHSHETEVLLPPDCQFKIHDFRQTDIGIEVDLECIPPGAAAGDTASLPQAHQTKGHAENILKQPVSGQKGTNAGGIYKGKDGKQRYVKFYKAPAQTYSEVLANELYKDLGIGAPNSQYFQDEPGSVSFASELVQGAEPIANHLSKDIAHQILNGFVADAVMSNWDVAGLDLENIVKTPDGKIMRIDNGSAFLTRAQGEPKTDEDLFQLTEFDGLPQKGMAKIFKAAGIKSAMEIPSIQDQYAKLRELRLQYTYGSGDAWRNYIDEKIPDAPEEIKQKMALSLTTKTKQAKKMLTGKPIDKSQWKV